VEAHMVQGTKEISKLPCGIVTENIRAKLIVRHERGCMHHRLASSTSPVGLVVLIDEADVFLEQSHHHELEHDALVPAALEILKCRHGVLFLTRNRI